MEITIDPSELEPEESAPDDLALRRVAFIAARQANLETQLEQLKHETKRITGILQMVRETDLPQAMTDCGLAEFKLLDGSAVTIETVYSCGQLDDGPVKKDAVRTLEQNLEALSWLEDNNHGDLTKNLVTIQLDKGQEELADKILDYLKSLKSNSMIVNRRRAVLWNTLAAFARRQEEQGEMLPLDKLGIRRITLAKISRAEKQKEKRR